MEGIIVGEIRSVIAPKDKNRKILTENKKLKNLYFSDS